MLGLFGRTKFNSATRQQANDQILRGFDQTLAASERLAPEIAACAISAPKTMGLDADMHDWSPQPAP